MSTLFMRKQKKRLSADVWRWVFPKTGERERSGVKSKILFDLCFFTIIELLVVIGIIAILATMLLPALNSAKARAKTTVCASQMKQVSMGFQLYQCDFDSYFPEYQRGNAVYPWAHTLSDYLGYLPYYRASNGEPAWNSIWFCPESVKGCRKYRSLSTNNNLFKYNLSYAYPQGLVGDLRGLGGGDTSPPAKLTQIRSPSITMALVEVVSSKTVGTETFNLPNSHINVQASPVPVFGWHDRPSKGTNLLAVDGHVDYYANGYQMGEKFGDKSHWQREAPFNTDWN